MAGDPAGVRQVIWLVGGTSEARTVAAALLARGLGVVVTTATEVPSALPDNPRLSWRPGRLHPEEMTAFIAREAISLVIDASHPYAREVQESARRAATRSGIAYLRFERPGAGLAAAWVCWAASHEEAARLAFSFGRSVLLTTGSSHLAPYVQAARQTGLPLFARVLPHPSAEVACQAAGLDPACLIEARGPFGVEENRETIQRLGIGVLVTKDSGQSGGVPEKLEAARLEGCQVVALCRSVPVVEGVHSTLDSLLAALDALIAAGRGNAISGSRG